MTHSVLLQTIRRQSVVWVNLIFSAGDSSLAVVIGTGLMGGFKVKSYWDKILCMSTKIFDLWIRWDIFICG